MNGEHNNSVDRKVRSWLMQLPGCYRSLESAHECYSRAWGDSKIQCSLPAFTDALKRTGYEVQQVRTYKHTIFSLNLPATGIASHL